MSSTRTKATLNAIFRNKIRNYTMTGLLSSLPKRSEWTLPVWTGRKNYFFEEFRVSFEISLCANGATRFTFKYLDHEWRRETWPVLTTLNQRFPDHFENKIAKFFITHIFSRFPWGFKHLKCRKNSLSKPLFGLHLVFHSTRLRPITSFETVLVLIYSGFVGSEINRPSWSFQCHLTFTRHH